MYGNSHYETFQRRLKGFVEEELWEERFEEYIKQLWIHTTEQLGVEEEQVDYETAIVSDAADILMFLIWRDVMLKGNPFPPARVDQHESVVVPANGLDWGSSELGLPGMGFDEHYRAAMRMNGMHI